MVRMIRLLSQGILTGLGFLFVLIPLSAQDWPQWRGPGRDGRAAGVSLSSFPETLQQVWRKEVGEGHSSPVVVKDRVYLHTREDEQEVVRCLDLATGDTLWEASYPVPYTMHPAALSHGKGPKSTPVLQEGFLVTLGITGVLSCFDAATGELVWRKDFSGEFPETSPWYGTAMSPLIDHGRVIAHVGGHDRGALRVFDLKSGEALWSWDGDGPGYASPVTVEVGGTRQLVTQTQEKIVGLSLSTGELLWELPFATAHVQNIITPVVYEDLLIFSGFQKSTFAVRVERQPDGWSVQEVWDNPDLPMYMSSPVLDGPYLFGMSHQRKGQYFCLDARTGQKLWTSRGREGENAAVILAQDHLFFLTDDAELVVVRKTPESFEKIAQYTVADSATWAHPVILPSWILVKDAATLILWSWK